MNCFCDGFYGRPIRQPIQRRGWIDTSKMPLEHSTHVLTITLDEYNGDQRIRHREPRQTADRNHCIVGPEVVQVLAQNRLNAAYNGR